MNDASFGARLGWRSLSSPDLEREYSPSSCVGGNIGPYLTEYSADSQVSRTWCVDAGLELRTLSYGGLASQTIDFVTPKADNAPLVLYIHGGYWQQLSKLESFGPASSFLSNGIAYAAVDYTLAPEASLDEIVAECRDAATTLASQATELGIDPKRIVLAGSSAGAHLAAMVALDPHIRWTPAGMVLLSGVYDLEPLLATTVNDAVGMDEETAHRNSPARLVDPNPATDLVSAVIAWGDNETDQFKQQSRLFAELLGSKGGSVTVVEAPERNHFNIVGDLGRSDTPLGLATAELIGSARRD